MTNNDFGVKTDALSLVKQWFICFIISLCIFELVLTFVSTFNAQRSTLWLLSAVIGSVFITFFHWLTRKKMITSDSAGLLTRFIDETSDLIILRDASGNILDCNRRVADALGFSMTDLRKMNIVSLDSDCFLRRHPHVTLDINLGQTKTYETEFNTQSGTKIHVEVATRLAHWSEDPVYIDVIRDITQRKKEQSRTRQSRDELERVRNKLESRMQIRAIELERQIRNRQRAEKDVDEIRHFLSNLIDSMPSAIIAIDAQKNVTQWNKRAEQLTGIDADDSTGRNLLTLLPEVKPHIEVSSTAINGGAASHSQRITASMQNKQYLFEMTAYPLKASTYSGLVIRIDDVTEKVRLEETLVQTEKMLSLGGLAAGMAHEINNPLGAILQSSQNILRRLSLEREQNHKIAQELNISLESTHQYLTRQRIITFVESIQKAGQRAANIVNDMLSFARPARGDAMLVNLADSLDSAVRLANSDYNQKKKLDFKKVQIIKEFPDVAISVMAQKNQLEQVFLNLLINAAQAMADMMQLEPPQIILRLSIQDNLAMIEVIDNGPGMDDPTKRRIFEPFFTTKEEGSGTGLGLSVSYFIITEQMKGSMEVDTSVGRGTRFIINLPLNPQRDSTKILSKSI